MTGAIDFVAAMLPAMAHPNNIEARVSVLEKQVLGLTERVRGIEQDAAAARVLAGGADRDVAEIRKETREFRAQNTKVLNAMREDLNDLRQRMDGEFTEIRGKLDAAATGQQYIADLLTRLIDQENAQ